MVSHPVGVVADEDQTPCGASMMQGGCLRRATMVSVTSGFGADGERRCQTLAIMGGIDGGGTNLISMGAVIDDSASLVGTCGDESAMGRLHSTSRSGTTDVHPWITLK